MVICDDGRVKNRYTVDLVIRSLVAGYPVTTMGHKLLHLFHDAGNHYVVEERRTRSQGEKCISS